MTLRLDREGRRLMRALRRSTATDMVAMCRDIGEDPANFFEGEDWSGLDLRNCDLNGVSFRDAIVDRVTVTPEQEKLILASAPRSMRDLRVEVARISLRGQDLRDWHLRDLDLTNADLREVDLRGADLYGADLSEADLSGANLCRAYLSRADLREADLREANLRGAKLRGADLSRADLREANLRGADLSGAKPRGADLRGADLFGAKLQSADLTSVLISTANASFADFTDAEGLDKAVLDRFFGCAGTTLPEGYERPDHWHREPLEDYAEALEACEAWKVARREKRLPPFGNG